ncbi:MAG: thiamine-phosphate pyrophosphorylase [Candidatus Omnitrophica bacterium]|nr:thiamine-phosphate pyrophosphorylase [Candidatus Omnitrophota bacterium]
MKNKILRIADANFNRAKEALRVIEDIFRFFTGDKLLTQKTRLIRHELSSIFSKKMLKEMVSQRNSLHDIGRNVDYLELKKKDIQDILFANFQRAKESIRVLEEIFKIINKNKVGKFKKMRYNLYFLERSAREKFNLHNNR